ncbi:hypothetical protein [Bradyrhizobium genosp. P]|uniref:hypothetical protein n=1 Tax=Bradyrhizobium genosp. P TaxID=83641 RepID=UPI003CF6DA62
MFMVILAFAAIGFVLCLFPAPRSYLARVGRAVWVCRVSAISVSLGLLLFARVTPARDLFVEINAGLLYWLVFFVLALAWALCVHYGARKALEQQAWAAGNHSLPLPPNIAHPLQQQFAFIGTWLPRLLGLACFGAIAWGVVGAAKTSALMDTGGDGMSSYFHGLLAATMGTALLFLLIVIFRRLYSTSLEKLVWGDPKAVIAEPSPIWFLKFLLSRRQRVARAAHYGGIKADWIAILIVIVVLVCFAASMIVPLLFGYLVPRAWFVPVMLGLPVFPLSILTAFSHRLRFPIFFLLVLLFGLLSILAPSYHDIRYFKADEAGSSQRQIGLEDALKQWEKLNCGASQPDNNRGCGQHPVIVALAGGASRASYLAVTVLGDILDLTQEDPAFHDFGGQMFAISGVSGGAVAAAMMRSALTAAGPNGRAPCKSTDALWYGFEGRGLFSAFSLQPVQQTSWKACLQSIAAGDFLSPAILGLAFRDPWSGFGLAKRIGSEDRAVLLERSFEIRYATLLADPTSFFSRAGQMIGSDPYFSNGSGLATPLGHLTAGPHWAPLLLLNATSVDTGRRVIASELAPSYSDASKRQRRVFPEAYDLFEEFPDHDVPLSTAATLSARFPIVSPYGAVPTADPRKASERAVDGGYFENDGVTTALEVARAIRELRPGIEPVIIHITNDPVQRADDNVSPGGMPASKAPKMPSPRTSQWFESLTNPVAALVGTRGGHAAQAVEAARAADHIKYVRFQVFNQTPPTPSGARSGCHLRDPPPPESDKVAPIDDVSMSWWLSGAVQEYLDRQLCHHSNKEAWAVVGLAEGLAVSSARAHWNRRHRISIGDVKNLAEGAATSCSSPLDAPIAVWLE